MAANNNNQFGFTHSGAQYAPTGATPYQTTQLVYAVAPSYRQRAATYPQQRAATYLQQRAATYPQQRAAPAYDTAYLGAAAAATHTQPGPSAGGGGAAYGAAADAVQQQPGQLNRVGGGGWGGGGASATYRQHQPPKPKKDLPLTLDQSSMTRGQESAGRSRKRSNPALVHTRYSKTRFTEQQKTEDAFGMFVASALKELPKENSINLQAELLNQINKERLAILVEGRQPQHDELPSSNSSSPSIKKSSSEE